ncbi:MAG: phosphoribosylamine--glycine ligase [Planctomycetes bacterium]|nr:phosphoribosylamine--glycine ligase [Planctomycetota bacterium]
MKILIIGGGGREHALAWKLSQSPRNPQLFCAPGNAGIASLATCADIGADNVPVLLEYARKQNIDLVVVGPEAALAAGIVDAFQDRGMRIFGPTREAAEIETSKSYCKNLFRKHNIPTASYRVFDRLDDAARYLDRTPHPVVIKADGIAAGKGVFVCRTPHDSHEALVQMMKDRIFGKAGERVVIEEFLAGEEVSVLALTDGQTIAILESAQDHKRVFDADEGPNTGGMGAYSPAPVFTDEIATRVAREVFVPMVHALREERRPYKGILYAGLMLTRSGPKVLEVNARFGDPETQPLMVRLKTDLLDLIEATIDGKLSKVDLEWDPSPAVCVVAASGGYPGEYKKGLEITGLEDAERMPGVHVFHSGTALRGDKVVTAGGRVLGVTATGATHAAARDLAYRAMAPIQFEGIHYRRDIGQRALRS